jgi:acyl carrier protein
MSTIDHDGIDSVVRGLLADIAPEADIDGLAVDAPLQDTVDLDSVDFLNLVTAIWQATGVDIPERDYPQVATLRSCIAYITRHQGTAPTTWPLTSAGPHPSVGGPWWRGGVPGGRRG